MHTVLVSSSFALDPHKTILQYTHTNWQTDDGLPQDAVQCIQQTRDGYIWVGTQEGLARFDGVKFTVFDRTNTEGINNNSIQSLSQTADGSLWAGTQGGLTHIVGGRFTTYTMADGLANDNVYGLYEDTHQNLWIATGGGGLNVWKNGKFKNYTTKDGLAHNFITSITGGKDGTIYIGTTGGLTKYSNGIFTTYRTAEGPFNINVLSLCLDSDNVLWVGTIAGLYQLKNGKWTIFTTKNGLTNDRIRSILNDRDGNLWIGTEGGGINRMRGTQFSYYSMNDGLIDVNVWTFFEDSEGNLWAGTLSGGLHCFHDGKFTVYGEKEGLSQDNTRAIYETRDGSVWVGTDNRGLTRFKDGALKIYTTTFDNASFGARAICEGPDGSLWVGTYGGGLCRLKNGRWTTYTTKGGLANDRIFSLIMAKDNTLWIGTRGGGISLLKNGNFTTYSTSNGLTNNEVRNILEASDGSIWICTSSGLNRLKDGKLTNYTTKDGLSYNIVYTIFEDENKTLWIGTYGGGLNRLKDGRFTAFSTQQGMYDNTVFQIIEDNQKNFWLTCNRGIYRVSKKELNDYADGKIQTIHCTIFGTADGLRSAKCNGSCQPAGIRTSDGKLWIPTMKGVAIVDPAKFMENKIPPPVFIEQALFDKHAVQIDSVVQLGPGEGDLELHYTALNYAAPKLVRFKYMLVGFDKDWIDADTRRVAYYTNIPPGKYTFKVIARTNDGDWNLTGAALKVNFAAYYYQTIWFRILMAIVVLVVGFGVYRFRIKTLRRDERELVRIVDDRTKHLQLEIGERKRAEETLRKTEKNYRLLFEQNLAGVYQTTDEGDILDCNDAFISMLGYSSREELRAHMATDLFFAETARNNFISRLRTEGFVKNSEIALRRKDGTIFFGLENATLLTGDKHLLSSTILGTIVDITERKQAEKAQQESEKRFREMFDDAPVGYHELDAEGRFTRVNRTELQMLGYTAEEMIGQYGWKFVADAEFSRQRVLAKLNGTMPPSRGAERTYQRKDGTELPVLIEDRILRDAQGKITGIRTIIQNLTERKQAEEAQREIEERYQRLVEFSPDAIAVHSDGKFLYVNPAAIKLIGAKDASELIGKPFLDIIHPDYKNAVNKRIKMGMEEGKTLPLIEEKFLRLDGGIIDVEVTSLPIVLKGKPAMQVVASDITERKKLRIELLQSQKMQSIGTLAGGIAHDFNNILGIILGYTGLLNKHKLDDQKFTESLSAITQTVQRGAALVRQILTFARKTDILFEPINLIDLAHELLSMLKQTFPKIITVQEIFAEDLPYIHADHTQIHQALLNLCVNARDAMPKGGTITFKAEKQPREQVQERFPAANQDSYICISVTDTGEGMDELTRLRIFDPFFTTKPLGRGTGMGLSVVYGVMQAHQGFINVESQLGRGTTFRLYFPILIINEKDVVPQTPTESFAIGGTETILFVEDEDLLVETVCIFLESKGYIVHIAHDGIEAVKVYKEHRHEIDLVLTDLGLPGMTGTDEFKKLKEINPDVGVIFASGFFDPDIKSELLKAGARGFIQKPYTPDDILKKLREVLDEKNE